MRIADIARAQHGLVTTRQLVACGLTRPAITRRVAAGRLHRVHRKVYAVGHAALSRHAQFMAAVLAVGPDAVLSHTHAAELAHLGKPARGPIHVTTTRRIKSSPGIHVHQTRRLTEREVTTRHGIPVTTAARTILDLASVLDPYPLARVIHEAAFRDASVRRQLRKLRPPHRTRNSNPALVRALHYYDTGSVGPRSRLELDVVGRIDAAGLPPPLLNCRIAVPGGGHVEADLHWPELRLVVEIDGPGHERPSTRRADARRDAQLAAVRIHVERLTHHEIEFDPDAAIARVAAALDLARARMCEDRAHDDAPHDHP